MTVHSRIVDDDADDVEDISVAFLLKFSKRQAPDLHPHRPDFSTEPPRDCLANFDFLVCKYSRFMGFSNWFYTGRWNIDLVNPTNFPRSQTLSAFRGRGDANFASIFECDAIERTRRCPLIHRCCDQDHHLDSIGCELGQSISCTHDLGNAVDSNSTVSVRLEI